MPRVSKKAKVVDAVFFDAALQMMDMDSDNESGLDEIVDNLAIDMLLVSSCRYGSISRVPKQYQWLDEVLPSLDENRFKAITRLTRHQFHVVLHLIRDFPMFHKGNQFPVSVQLAITLYRFGVYGLGARYIDVANLFGIGDGSSVSAITRRVIRAILKLRPKFMYWPNANERAQLAHDFFDELPNCIGWIDGTPVNLAEAPLIDHESYYDKNKNYSIKLQLICDHTKRIRHYVAGYPGSVHDSRVWNECDVKKKQHLYFSGDEYLAGDLGYALSSIVMTPFKDNSKESVQATRNKYNKYFSKLRVRIEHCNGILKETFGSLKELRIKIRDQASHKEATDWIVACLVLYNIILPFNSTFETNNLESDEDNYLEDDGSDAVVGDEDDAREKRLALCEYISSKI